MNRRDYDANNGKLGVTLAIRRRVRSHWLSRMSEAMKRRPSTIAAAAVVPEPENGS